MWRLLALRPAALAREEAFQGLAAPEAFRPLESPWEARRADPRPWPEPLYFVDGKEREEALLAQGERVALLGSVAAGALVHQGGRMTLLSPVVRRVGVGLSEPLRVGELLYEPVEAEGTDYPSLRAGLQKVREDLEKRVAQGLSGGLLVVDGPVRFPRPGGPLLGYIKTHWARYLPEEEEALLHALRPGERTPAFQVSREGQALASWYVRLPLAPEGFRPPQAGLLRVETPLKGPYLELADLSLNLFPALASHPVKDPRAPQNLTPIGALERELARRMGSQEVVDRLLRRHLGGG
ncbi:DNA double-strand break repair nuclease NurA [Thermus aquaticus]|uniref:Single-stranded exonuclease associated with Rad50/Mre11 complex n=1 Tax=Thermus aquaticus (strain ATCC BAA-2747 / Y51MC23) TaxID=498848 RepID=A0ABN4IKD1_THEA5|nr:single-stranded exonuclease associated with Rad50/Mre11 complex [Thermus aquaticus Y51MC23]